MKEIMYFLGAGASTYIGMPDTKQFIANRTSHKFNKKVRKLLETIITILQRRFKKEDIDIEMVYTIISSSHKEEEKYSGLSYAIWGYGDVLSDEEVITNDFDTINSLKNKIEEEIVSTYWNIKEEKRLKVYDQLFENSFTRDIGMYKSENLLSIYTTNYDKCIEFYLNNKQNNHQSRRRWKYNMGLVRKREGYTIFDIKKLKKVGRGDSKYHIFLYKLHGSIDWVRLNGGAFRKIETNPMYTLGTTTSDGRKIENIGILYPLLHKLDYNHNPIFREMQEYLSNSLKNGKRTIIVGFSFRDDFIRECFVNNLNPKNKVILISPNASKIINERLPEIEKNITPFDIEFPSDEIKEIISEATATI